MAIKSILKGVVGIFALGIELLEQKAAAKRIEYDRKSLVDEVRAFRIDPEFRIKPDSMTEEESGVFFIMDDDFGLPEGFEWTEPPVYEVEITRPGDKKRTFIMPDGTVRQEELADEEDDDDNEGDDDE